MKSNFIKINAQFKWITSIWLKKKQQIKSYPPWQVKLKKESKDWARVGFSTAKLSIPNYKPPQKTFALKEYTI